MGISFMETKNCYKADLLFGESGVKFIADTACYKKLCFVIGSFCCMEWRSNSFTFFVVKWE